MPTPVRVAPALRIAIDFCARGASRDQEKGSVVGAVLTRDGVKSISYPCLRPTVYRTSLSCNMTIKWERL